MPELIDHVTDLYRKRSQNVRAAMTSETTDFGEGDRPEVVTIEPENGLVEVVPARIRRGQVSRD